MTAETAQLLFAIWAIPEQVNTTRMVTELTNRIFNTTCVGPDLFQYR
jgi:hypothetical protein